MLLEGNYNTGVFQFKLDGVPKTINGAVTGAALYQVAGNPTLLETVDGEKIENNHEVLDFGGQEMEFITKTAMATGPEINPEHLLASDQTVVDPPHGETLRHVSAEEAEQIRDRTEQG